MTEGLRPYLPVDAKAARSPESAYRLLPEAAVAIVTGSSAVGTDVRQFKVAIGPIDHFPGVINEPIKGVRSTTQDWIIGLKQLDEVCINVTVEQTRDKVTLGLHDLNDYDLIEVGGRQRLATVDAARFTELGLDLRTAASAKPGTIFGRELSQFFYDFQVGQREFATDQPQQ